MRRSGVFAMIAAEQAQQTRQPKEDAAIIVEGAVRGVYRTERPGRTDYIVQLQATRTELGAGAADVRRQPIPAPGDPVYVHVFQDGQTDSQGYSAVPDEGATIRAYLFPRMDGGGWAGAFPDWFDQKNARPSLDGESPPTDAPHPSTTGRESAPSASVEGVLKTIGISVQPLEVKGRKVLRITNVLTDSPAQKAGFEKGDVVIGVNGSGFSSLSQFADLISKSGRTVEFVILNVRNNEQTTVPVDLGATASPPAPSEERSPAPRRGLGVSVEPVRVGLRSGLKVTSLQADGPAQAAGIEVGDILVEAGGSRLSDDATLQRVLDQAGESLTVTVRDSRSGKDVPVEIALGKSTPDTRPTPSPEPSDEGERANLRRLGVSIKAGTIDLLPVVKVTAVTPGGPADKAGLEVGDAVVGIDDRVVFAPDLLEEALQQVGRKFTLTVLDAKTGKKTPVPIDLGR